MRILHQQTSRPVFDSPDAPRRIPQQHDFSRHAFGGEIFIHRAHDNAFRFRHHREQRVVGNRAAARDRRQARPAPRSQFAVDAIVMQVSAIAASLRGDSFGKHCHHGVESFAREIAIGIGTLHERE